MSIENTFKFKCKLLLVMLTFVSCNSLTVHAQHIKLPSHQFDEVLTDIEIPEQFRKYSVVILEDKIKFNISSNSVVRYLRIKILKDNYHLNLKHFIVPQSFDISTDIFNEPRYKAEKINYPLATLDFIKEFDMRIIKSNGRKVDITPKDSLVPYNFMHLKTTFKMFNVFFEIPELEKNDELEIYYRHEPSIYAINVYSSIIHDFYNYRIFFNNEYPKINYELKIRAKTNDAFKISSRNYNSSVDSFVEKVGTLTDQVYVYKANNLLPISNKWNSKYYESCQYVTYYKSGALQIFDNKNNFIGFKEYNWKTGLTAYSTIKPKYNGYDKTTAKVTSLNNLHKHIFNTSADTSIISLVKTFNDYINNEFEFSHDSEFISGSDMSTLKIGENLNKKIIRKYGSTYVYSQILDRFDRPYFKVAINDNRIANLNFDKYSNEYKMPGLFAIPFEGNLYFLTSKKHRFGHHLNELPFYYENSNIVLIPQNVQVDEETFLYKNYLAKLLYFKTPLSNETENQRIYNILANVDCENNSINFQCKLKLSGQFSTLIRGNFTYNYIDSIVHTDYYRKIYNLTTQSKLLSTEKTNESEIFPYITNFNIKYIDNSVLKKSDNSTIAINLKNLIQHVIEKDIDTLASNDFYFDFKQTDIFRYNFKFNQKIKLQNTDIQHVQNYAFGKYNFSIRQISDNDILIESSLLIDNERVSNNDLSQIVSLNNKITEIDKMVLNIKILNQ